MNSGISGGAATDSVRANGPASTSSAPNNSHGNTHGRGAAGNARKNPQSESEWLEVLDALEGASKYGLVKEWDVARVEEILAGGQRLKLWPRRPWLKRAVQRAA